MAHKKYKPTKIAHQRLKDLLEAEVPIWKIEKIMDLPRVLLNRYYPDLLEAIPPAPPNKGWEPTPDQIRQIEIMAGMGISNARIALVIGITKRALEARCSAEIARASVLMDMKVGANIYRMATGDPDSRNSAISAMFWAKTRMGWRENDRIEVTGRNGGPIQSVVQIHLPHNGREQIEQISDESDVIEGDRAEDDEGDRAEDDDEGNEARSEDNAE